MDADDGRTPGVPVRCVMPVGQLFGDDEEDTGLLRSMAVQAEGYLLSFPWCESVRQRYFGAGVGNVVAVFLFEIVSSRADVDEWLWVIVGDLPSAYLVTDICKTPSQALEGYIREMRKWAVLANKGQASDQVIPTNVPPTPYWSKELASRLEFLQDNIVSRFRDEEVKWT
jgi:hypothetical protein